MARKLRARAIAVSPEFFRDDITECSPAARILYLGLIAIADERERFNNDHSLIRELVFPYDDLNISELMAELEAIGYVVHDYELPWVKFQNVSHAVNLAASREYRHRRRAHLRNATINDFTDGDWNAVLEWYGNRCAYCLELSAKLTVEHITPVSRGGNHTLLNIAPACSRCNSSKGAKTPLEMIARLPKLEVA